MEELLVYAILFCEGIAVTDNIYQKKLHSLFLQEPDNDMLLTLECETNIKNAMIHIRTHFNYQSLNHTIFGAFLMDELKQYYGSCSDVKRFADKMYSLWKSLPDSIRMEQPFWTLSYADDPLSWGDEEQTRTLYEKMFSYYEKQT